MEAFRRSFLRSKGFEGYLDKQYSNIDTKNDKTLNNNNTNNNNNNNPFSQIDGANTKKGSFSESFHKNLEVKKRPRLVKKCGELNIHMENVPKHKRRLLSDFFNTILDIKWRWHIVYFLLSFMVSWFIFATVWYSIAFVHGDLNIKSDENQQTDDVYISNNNNNNYNIFSNLKSSDLNASTIFEFVKLMDNVGPVELVGVDSLVKLYESLPANDSSLNNNNNYTHLKSLLFKKITSHLTDSNNNNVNKKKTENHHTPCVHGIHDFTSALLYSVETQHTIGYGLRHITEECSFAIIFLMIQSCFGIFVQGLVAGVVFAKISRPNKRKRTIIFSHNAVVSERDGKLVFMFKLGNVRMSQLSDATIKMLMIKSRRTSEGEFIPFQSYEMKVGGPGTSEKSDSIFFPWPKTVEHIIDETSPMYDICKHLINKKTNTISTQSCNLETINSLDNSNISNSDSTGESNQSPCGVDSASSPTDWDQIEILNQAKNDDYEIVVMLEGNIETTGASCHIRTSYLPQEILFGYRFIPIYPKFTDFEYCFDYSKFDQVEPYQHSLMHLNVAHINRHLNYIFDARDELKNYQLTYQNTLNQDDLIKFKKVNQQNKQAFKSLKTVLSAFRAANQGQPTSYDDDIVSKQVKSLDSRLNSESSNDDRNNKNIDNHDGKHSNGNKNANLLFDQIDHKTLTMSMNNSPYQTISTDASNLKSNNLPVQNLFENFDQVELKNSLNRTNNNKKQGRFTIVPVNKCNEISIAENSTLLNHPISFKNESIRLDLNKNSQISKTKFFNRSTSSSTSSTMSSSMKKRTNILNQLSRKVLGQNHKNSTGAGNSTSFNNSFSVENSNNHLNHQRTYSLPPIYSQIELDSLLMNDKNKTGRNSLSDSIMIAKNDSNKLTSDTVTSQALKLVMKSKQTSFFIDDEGYLTSNKNNSKEEI